MQFDETPLENTDNATRESWPAPLTMFIAWLVRILDLIAGLKRVRRHTTKFKPNWRTHYAGLRQSEWHRDQILAHAAACLFAGTDPDDTPFDLIMDPPEDYGGPCPKTPFEMNRRFLALAQWLKDPDAIMQRHLARIAKRAGISGCPLRLASRATSPALRAEEENTAHVSSSSAQHWGRWRATSSSRDGGGSRSRQLNAQPRAPPTSPNQHTPHHLSAQRA